MTVGSLFAGIGGLDLGLERAGMKVIWQCEKDDYCAKVLNKHWPDVPVYSDVETLYTEDGPSPRKPDLLCGGFPCQDISIAGNGAGLDGDRSGLWWEFARTIRVVGPRYVVLENVPALVNRGLDAILGWLAESGYDAEWTTLTAAQFGTTHLRTRLFLVAYPSGSGREECYMPTLTRKPGHHPRANGGPRPRGAESQSAVLREGDDVPRRVDRIRGLGNAVVPQVAEFVGHCIINHSKEE